jgi:hypothetical protein
MLAVRFFRSMRTLSPVLSSARPPPVAASGEALRIEGEPEVPDWRPSPMHGECGDALLDQVIRRRMFTTSAAPGYPTGPTPRMKSTVCSSIASAGIVDAVVVVLRPVEDDRLALEGHRVLRVRRDSAGGTRA